MLSISYSTSSTSDDVFVALIVVSIFLDLKDKKTNECIKKLSTREQAKLVAILIFHHIINIFANFGYLLSNKILLTLYIFAPVLMISYWKLNGDKCDVTLWANKICGWNGDKYFNDLFNIVGLKQHEWWHQYGHTVYSIAGITYAIYKLQKT